MPAKRERQEITLMERLRFLSDMIENLLPKRLKGLQKGRECENGEILKYFQGMSALGRMDATASPQDDRADSA